MKKSQKALLVFDISTLITSSWLYYYGFDLQSGIRWQVITWGFPLLVVILMSIAAIVLLIQKKNRIISFISIICAVLSIGYFWVVTYSPSNVLVPDPVIPEDVEYTEENKILSLVLTSYSPKSSSTEDNVSFIVVDPDTPSFSSDTVRDFVSSESIKSRLHERGYNVDALVDRLFEADKEPSRLKLASSLDGGYFIDYDSYFSWHHETRRGGFLNFYLFRLFHPHAIYGFNVSVPVYDSESGYVLIYREGFFPFVGGSGGVDLFKYEAGEVTFVAQVGGWIT
jgi:hypothetical protein